jgi:molybdate transport system ATP-binding protein
MPELAGALELVASQLQPIALRAEFACAPGELLALVGPSGSGKSTLLRCIAGLHSPQQGRIACGGATWYDAQRRINLPPQARRVGFVFQNYSLFPHLSALDNVACALGHLPASRRAERARDLLALTHLRGLDTRKPAQLSGGQQQRVALARALARDPAVLLLDEPFSAVDQVTRRRLQVELARLRSEVKIPIVLVTHDLDEARMLADRMTLLSHGRTLQSGTPEDILTRPASAQIARLVELNNVFGGTLESVNADGSGTLCWRSHKFEVARTNGFAAATRLSWVIPPEDVILHRRDRPSLGERENPIDGRVDDCLHLGDATRIVLALEGDTRARISFSVPTHVVRRNGVAAGEQVRVSLLASGIHLMPAEADRPT